MELIRHSRSYVGQRGDFPARRAQLTEHWDSLRINQRGQIHVLKKRAYDLLQRIREIPPRCCVAEYLLRRVVPLAVLHPRIVLLQHLDGGFKLLVGQRQTQLLPDMPECAVVVVYPHIRHVDILHQSSTDVKYYHVHSTPSMNRRPLPARESPEPLPPRKAHRRSAPSTPQSTRCPRCR